MGCGTVDDMRRVEDCISKIVAMVPFEEHQACLNVIWILLHSGTASILLKMEPQRKVNEK